MPKSFDVLEGGSDADHAPGAIRPGASVVETAVRKFLLINNIRFDLKSDSWHMLEPSGREVTVTWDRMQNLFRLYGSKTIKRSLKSALAAAAEIAYTSRANALAAMIQDIEGWPRDDGETLRRWLQSVCQDGYDLSYAVMAHWIWGVRRKLLGMPTENHVCPILYGLSGGGKSCAARAFVRPLHDVSIELTLGQLGDERHWKELERHYVIYVDEMAGSDRIDIATLKSLITQETTASHIFHSQRREITKQNASFIGSSNKPVDAVIYDVTSGRRWWELRCRDRLDWQEINAIDYRTIWASVDPRQASPLQGEQLAQVLTLQHEKLRQHTPIEEWVREYEIEPGDRAVPIGVMFDHYCTFCASARVRGSNKFTFSKQLREFKLQGSRTYDAAHKKRERVMLVSDACYEKFCKHSK